MSRRAVRFYITGEVLRQVLGMPPDSTFLSAAPGPYPDQLEFTVADPALPEVPEGCNAPLVEPRITERRITWEWNAPGSAPSTEGSDAATD